ncbi:MAG: TIGR02300 family protein, partial [Pseudorhodoplanes sp.]|nr:TIGR02300 family protein [Pseudorhodoplanes sp.]
AESESPELESAEFVSLEDADAEAQGKAKVTADSDEVPDTDDIEVEDDETLDDAAFIEEEEGSDDVTDIIGEGIEKEDET